MVHDLVKGINISVSDKRPTIIHNLHKRFQKANIKDYISFIADLEKISQAELIERIEHQYFDIIIADVPCTGSGTWARTPEDLCFFKKNDIER
jgi:16S rRNA (cytosine967-C5)-methyltransferase